jgi:Effector-associated domain 10
MLEGLEKLKAILQSKLSDDEVGKILAELTVASGEGSVSIGGDATEAVIVTGDKNVIGDNNQVTINHGTDAETMREILRLIEKNIKVANSPTADREKRTIRGKVSSNNTPTAVKPSTVKKSTRSPKRPNATQISKNITILNNTRNSVPVRITAAKELGKAKGDNSAISWLLSLIKKRNENNDLIAAGITALSKISDGRGCIVTTIISTLRFNQSSSVVISAMNAFGKIAIENSDAVDKMLNLLSNHDNTIEMKESIIRNLGKVANGNNKAIDRLIPILNSAQDLIKIRKLVADSLVQIDRGYPATSAAMAYLLADKKLSTSFKDYIAASLKKIDPSNSKLAAYIKASTKK